MTVEILQGAPEVPDARFESERAIVAGSLDFASDCGGPLTRAFLERLPRDFRDGRLMIDSFLVFLREGESLPTRFFHRERPFDAEHVACAFGAPAQQDFLAGALPDEPIFAGAERRHAVDREQRLLQLRERGLLQQIRVPVHALHRFPGSAFRRSLPASSAGFHFYIRATRGAAQLPENIFRADLLRDASRELRRAA